MEWKRTLIELDRNQQKEQQDLQSEDVQYNAEQAVTKHFEESLRRAKEKQLRAAWTVNTIPASQQTAYQQQYLRSNHNTSDEHSSSNSSVKRIFWPQDKNNHFSKLNIRSDVVKHTEHISEMHKTEVLSNGIKAIDKKQIIQNDSAPANEMHTPKMELIHDTSLKLNPIQLSQPNIVKAQFHQTVDQNNVQRSSPLIASHHSGFQQQIIFVNTQMKPKVSSPAPSKIYGRPGGTSQIDQICKKAVLNSVNQTQSKISTDPPPAHTQPQQTLSSHDLHVKTSLNCFSPLSHSPGNLLKTAPLTNTYIDSSMHIQSKPLDLGISARSRNINSNNSKSITNDRDVLCPQSSNKSVEMEFIMQDQTLIHSNPEYSETIKSDQIVNLPRPQINTKISENIEIGNLSKGLISNGISDNSNDVKITDPPKMHSINTITKSIDCNSGDEHIQSANLDYSRNLVQFASPTSLNTPADNQKSSSQVTAPRHLKKAWLQRHNTAEDCENKVTIPNKLSTDSTIENKTNDNTLPKESLINPLSPPSPNGVNKRPGIIQRGRSDLDHRNDTSSSDQLPVCLDHENDVNYECGSQQKKNKSEASDIEEISAEGVEMKSDDSDKGKMSDIIEDESVMSQDKQDINQTNKNDLEDTKEKENASKRGRRSKNETENINAKKRKTINTKESIKRPTLSQLKRTGESFLQDGPCFEVAPKLAKCRECRWTANQRSKNTSSIFCRFYAFRKLRYTKAGQLAIAGFCDPDIDPTESDLKLWMPDAENPPKDLDLVQAKFVLAKVSDQFCDLYVQEKMATPENMSGSKTVAWKRVVKGVREMCDVCATSLFNYHWTCSKCGFVVCIDCYKARKYGENKIWNNEWNSGCDRDEYQWLLCTNRAAHEQERLMLTQIIAGDSLQILCKRIHRYRNFLKIPQTCGCLMSREEPPIEIVDNRREFIQSILIDRKWNLDCSSSDSEANAIKNKNKSDETEAIFLKNQCSAIQKQQTDLTELKFDDDSSEEGENNSALRDLLIGSSNKSSPINPINDLAKNSISIGDDGGDDEKVDQSKATSRKQLFDQMMANTLLTKKKEETEDLLSNQPRRNRYLPVRVMTMALSQELYPNVKHMWLCEGKLLRLLDPTDVKNLEIFQQQWKRGQPVMISHVDKCLNMDIWQPESFSRDFGEDANDLINCLTGTLVPNQPMKRFWDGFDYLKKRIKDDKGEPMLLKLKDWPPGEDFAETLPTRFTDLMKSLPLCDYTKRNGKFNLASRLPEFFVKPDLGPKMYNAYGSVTHPTRGTTNLHLDISDAVNVMVHVGIPKDDYEDALIKEAYRAIDEAGCDIFQRRRVREKNELPGAIWHIYSPRDANKIRDLLNKVAIERGERLEPSHDAIHDQSWYLDSKLRARLYNEYGVEGYPIAQCLGDAIFIPAGAPHQVRNLLNCIKVAEDFVSPENVSECFHLTHEFRALSETHSNHEDKLQIKNIIYYAVKDALSVLSNTLEERQFVNKQENHMNETVKLERLLDAEQEADRSIDCEVKPESNNEKSDNDCKD